METGRFEVFNVLAEGVQVIDRDWRYAYVNESVIEHGKTNRERLIGTKMSDAYPEIEKTDLFQNVKNCMNEKVPSRFINEFIFPDKSVGWFDLRILPVDEGVLILSIDVTDQILAEKDLYKTNEELKLRVNQIEILLRELQHRVRNNLQMILSLINLYSTHIENSKVLDAIDECRNYVLSLSMVYNSMHDEMDITKVDIQELIRRLARFHRTQFQSSVEVHLKLSKKGNYIVSIDNALTFGLLVNELIKDAVRNNFDHGKTENHQLIITLDENNHNFNFQLGLQGDNSKDVLIIDPKTKTIVEALSEQLNGEFKMSGNFINISFKRGRIRIPK